MKKISEPIVFFGSGPVAAESLRRLAKHFEIEAVITKPRAAHHKGDVPVLSLAEELGLPVHTVQDRRSLDALFAAASFQSRAGILVDFGIIVSQAIIDFFPLGIINSHFSLLPEWRGADPITFAVLSGQPETGVSLMLLTAGMDEGPILAYAPYAMPPDITTPELTDVLVELSDQLLAEIVPPYIAGEIQPQPQAAGQKATYSRKLTKADGVVDWHKPAAILEREVRAFAAWPKSHASLGGMPLILIQTHVLDASGPAGTTAIADKLPAVYCGEQALALDIVKPAGKQAMSGQAFLAGYKKQFLDN